LLATSILAVSISFWTFVSFMNYIYSQNIDGLVISSVIPNLND